MRVQSVAERYASLLAEIANYLSVNKKIFGPTPGKTLLIGETVDYSPENVEWISLKDQRLIEIKEAGRKFRENPTHANIRPISSNQFPQNNQEIENELNKLGKVFMLSEMGGSAIDFISSRTYLAQPYGLAIKFYINHVFTEMKYYVLNLNTAQFELIRPEEANEDEIPFGLELFLNDFIGIISGHIQIWDLGGIGIKSWYSGQALNSPVAFLYSYYGEQISPELSSSRLPKRYTK